MAQPHEHIDFVVDPIRAGLGSGIFTTASGLWVWLGENSNQVGLLIALVGMCFSVYFSWKANKKK